MCLFVMALIKVQCNRMQCNAMCMFVYAISHMKLNCISNTHSIRCVQSLSNYKVFGLRQIVYNNNNKNAEHSFTVNHRNLVDFVLYINYLYKMFWDFQFIFCKIVQLFFSFRKFKEWKTTWTHMHQKWNGYMPFCQACLNCDIRIECIFQYLYYITDTMIEWCYRNMQKGQSWLDPVRLNIHRINLMCTIPPQSIPRHFHISSSFFCDRFEQKKTPFRFIVLCVCVVYGWESLSCDRLIASNPDECFWRKLIASENICV